MLKLVKINENMYRIGGIMRVRDSKDLDLDLDFSIENIEKKIIHSHKDGTYERYSSKGNLGIEWDGMVIDELNLFGFDNFVLFQPCGYYSYLPFITSATEFRQGSQSEYPNILMCLLNYFYGKDLYDRVCYNQKTTNYENSKIFLKDNNIYVSLLIFCYGFNNGCFVDVPIEQILKIDYTKQNEIIKKSIDKLEEYKIFENFLSPRYKQGELKEYFLDSELNSLHYRVERILNDKLNEKKENHIFRY